MKRYERMALTYHWYTVILIERLVWYCLWIQCRYARWIYACSRSSWELIDRYVVQWCRLSWCIIDSSICCNYRLIKRLNIEWIDNMVEKIMYKVFTCFFMAGAMFNFLSLKTTHSPYLLLETEWILNSWTNIRTMWQMPTSACKRCASCSVSNVTNPYPLLTPARSTMIFVDFTFPYDEKTRHSSASVVSPLQQSMYF